MNPYEKYQAPKVKVVARAKTSIMPVFLFLVLSVVVLGLGSAARGF